MRVALLFLFSLLSAAVARAEVAAPLAIRPGDQAVAAVRAADDARVAAMIAVDKDALDAIFSDDLRYAHSNGNVDTKASFVAALASKRSHYRAIEYSERTFTPVAPGIVLMAGRCTAKVVSNDQPLDLTLSFLAVWREENGRWRFLAWQSCRIPPPTPAPASK